MAPHSGSSMCRLHPGATSTRLLPGRQAEMVQDWPFGAGTDGGPGAAASPSRDPPLPQVRVRVLPRDTTVIGATPSTRTVARPLGPGILQPGRGAPRPLRHRQHPAHTSAFLGGFASNRNPNAGVSTVSARTSRCRSCRRDNPGSGTSVAAVAGLSLDGQYWARTSDPQLSIRGDRSRRFAQVRSKPHGYAVSPASPNGRPHASER